MNNAKYNIALKREELGKNPTEADQKALADL
jgi:hypothetical protein